MNDRKFLNLVLSTPVQIPNHDPALRRGVYARHSTEMAALWDILANRYEILENRSTVYHRNQAAMCEHAQYLIPKLETLFPSWELLLLGATAIHEGCSEQHAQAVISACVTIKK